MKQRDIELLSSYLDGQLSSADAARLETRLRTDPEMRSVLQDLRGARSLLRQLPMRKAPRNFTLTPKMVGKNPPLPRSYPVFKFSATLATILLFFTIGLNMLGPQLAAQRIAIGGGGGGAPDAYQSTLATEHRPLWPPLLPPSRRPRRQKHLLSRSLRWRWLPTPPHPQKMPIPPGSWEQQLPNSLIRKLPMQPAAAWPSSLYRRQLNLRRARPCHLRGSGCWQASP